MSAQELITDHLDLWTGAVTHKSGTGRGSNGKVELTGIKKLRELILELALRGKLVEQDPEDEPASVLLEKIAEEKVRLAKEGKIKKPKKLPEIEEEEKPFELPKGWLWVRMETISRYIQRGKGPKYADSGEVRVVSQKCVQWSGFDISAARFIDDSSLRGYQDERYVKEGDILWNSTGTGTVGRAIVVEAPPCSIVADSHVTIIRPLVVEPRHVLNYISSPCVQKRIEPGHENSLVSGTTKQVELNSGSVKLLAIPLPPEAEQHRIVEKVDELMALCDRLEQQAGDQLEAHEVLVDTLLDALTRSVDAAELAENWGRVSEHFDTLFTTETSIEKLKQAVLHLAVTGRIIKSHDKIEKHRSIFEKTSQMEGFSSITEVAYPPHWKPSKLLDVSDKIVDCPHSTPKWAESGFICVRTNQFSPGKLDISSSKYVNEATYRERTARLEPEEDDILYSREGGILGVACRVPPRIKLCLGQRMMLIRPNRAKLRSQYLEMVLNSPSIKKVAEESTTGGAAPRVNMSVIKKYPIATPPLNEQDVIIERYEILISLCDQLKSRLGEASETRTQLAEAVVEQAVN